MRPNGKLSLISTCAAISLLAMVVLGSIVAVAQEHNASRRYKQVNLVSDIEGLAAVTDPNLVNPWGVAFSSTSPFWVSDNGTGVSTLYNGEGTPIPLIVTIPPPSGSTDTSTPTGTVFNGPAGFVVSKDGTSAPAFFIFDTEDGTISGWSPTVDLHNAVLVVDNSQPGGVDGSTEGAVYKGLAIAQTGNGSFIYANNFRDGIVEMYDADFHFVGSFTDPDLPPRYAPFGIRNIDGQLYVTFAEQGEGKKDDVAGRGHGFVDVFDTSGHLLRRFVSRGRLNSPWGLALAPANFGKFSGALLIGNFGDGRINAYDPVSGRFLGNLRNQHGQALSIDGLWTITFGNGGFAGSANELFFTAGINDEADGLFGQLQSLPKR